MGVRMHKRKNVHGKHRHRHGISSRNGKDENRNNEKNVNRNNEKNVNRNNEKNGNGKDEIRMTDKNDEMSVRNGKDDGNGNRHDENDKHRNRNDNNSDSNSDSQGDVPAVITLFSPCTAHSTHVLTSIARMLYGRQTGHVHGPATMRTSRTRRATFVVVPNDIYAMMDGAKVADMAILVVDGCTGMTREHAEYVTLMHAYGMPKVIVYVLDGRTGNETRTGSETIRHGSTGTGTVRYGNETVRHDKLVSKTVRHDKLVSRIRKMASKEVAPGTKVLTSMHMLVMHISMLRCRPHAFKQACPYVLIDHISTGRDGTVMRGYVRGKRLVHGSECYITGVGKVGVVGMRRMDDPCAVRDGERVVERRKVFMHAPMDDAARDWDRDGDRRKDGMKDRDRDRRKDGMKDGDADSDADKDVQQFMLFRDRPVMVDQGSDDNQDDDSQDDDQDSTTSIASTDSTDSVDNQDSTADVDIPFDELRKSALHVLKDNHTADVHVDKDVHADVHADVHVHVDMASTSSVGDYVEMTVTCPPIHNHSLLILVPCTYTAHTLNVSSFINSRHFPHFIKSNDPVIVSAGWQRMITFPLFFRHRHGLNVCMRSSVDGCMFCYYGTVAERDSRVVVVRRVEDGSYYRYRVVGTGSVQGMRMTNGTDCSSRNRKDISKDKDSGNRKEYIDSKKDKDRDMNNNGNVKDSTNTSSSISRDSLVYKKLRLVGRPARVRGNTAFIAGMFNSSLEVGRCLSACIKTVSGIRGVVKKAVGRTGLFRASFEGEIRENDVVMMDTYVKADVIRMVIGVDEKVRDVERLRLRRDVRTDVDRTDVDHTDVDHTDVDHTDVDREIGNRSIGNRSIGNVEGDSMTSMRSMTGRKGDRLPESVLCRLPLDVRMRYTQVVDQCMADSDEDVMNEIRHGRQAVMEEERRRKDEDERRRRDEEKERMRIRKEGIRKGMKR